MVGRCRKNVFIRSSSVFLLKDGEREKSGAGETESEASIVEPELSTEYPEGISGIKEWKRDLT